MERVHVLSGSRLVGLPLPPDAVLLTPPPSLEPLADVGAATVESLRYPLAGPSLEAIVTPGGRATIVVEPPLLPLPGAAEDPRRDALDALIEMLDQHGMRREDQTILIAGGLERRAGRRELEQLLRPDRARRFRGAVAVHDCERTELRHVGETAGIAARVAPELLETDLVLTVSAAETALNGGAATLAGAAGVGTLRALAADSLLEPSAAYGWQVAVELEATMSRHVPVVGVSIVLDLPRPSLPRGPLRVLHNLAPEGVRRERLGRTVRALHATAVLAGPPSVAHAEGLLRGTALRSVRLERPLDTIVVPSPWIDAHSPRRRPNPITVSAAALGLGLRLWRGVHPLADGGTIVLVHPLTRTMGDPDQAPYRRLFAALRDGPGARVRESEAVAGRDGRGIAAYRAGRAPHPRLPYADWEGCRAATRPAGRVIVAGCRDAGAARSLGFVPAHSLTVALEMAQGVSGPDSTIAILDGPPYAPLVVRSSS